MNEEWVERWNAVAEKKWPHINFSKIHTITVQKTSKISDSLQIPGIKDKNV
jgi:hypothetical protein